MHVKNGSKWVVVSFKDTEIMQLQDFATQLQCDYFGVCSGCCWLRTNQKYFILEEDEPKDQFYQGRIRGFQVPHANTSKHRCDIGFSEEVELSSLSWLRHVGPFSLLLISTHQMLSRKDTGWLELWFIHYATKLLNLWLIYPCRKRWIHISYWLVLVAYEIKKISNFHLPNAIVYIPSS